MSETTIQLRQTNLEETDNMAQFESPDGDAICASYVSRKVADQLGEYAQVTISDDAAVMADRTGFSGADDDGNYATFETPSGAVTGLYVARDEFDDEAPESIGLQFEQSNEDEFDEAAGVDEDEVEGLLADSSESDDEEDEQEVEITDEELELVEGE
jgi:hypothetical protein